MLFGSIQGIELTMSRGEEQVLSPSSSPVKGEKRQKGDPNDPNHVDDGRSFLWGM